MKAGSPVEVPVKKFDIFVMQERLSDTVGRRMT